MLQPADPRLWQYITYAFLHANLLHIVGNMLFLYIFGNNINDRMGNLGYLAFYLSGAVVAGIGYVIFDRQNPVLGASGAVAAVTGAYLILLPRSNISILYFFFFVGVVEIASLWFILIFFLMDVVGEVAPQFMGGTQAVAHAAHITGTLFGAALCIILLATGLLPRDQFDVVALAQRWNRRRVYRDVVASGYDPFGVGAVRRGRMAAAPPAPPDAATQRILDLRAQISAASAGHDLAGATRLYQQLLALDPNQVLSRSAQMDIATYLASQHQYPQAAAAYEQLVRFYPTYEQIEQVDLMLGMIYGRYLNRPDQAKVCLRRAIARLHFSPQLEMARAELAHLETPGI
jgi:membrane associated rhomboid family serine protease